MSKLTTLSQLKTSMEASKVYIDAQDATLSGRIDGAITKIETLEAAKGEANILEGISVNGTTVAITNKIAELLIAAGEENGTISVNGAAVAVAGLADMAFKTKVSQSDFDDSLVASFAALATNADLTALEVRVTDAEGRITVLENAGFQTADDVNAAIQAGIAGANHLKYAIVETLPTAEEADANTWYMLWNEETGHYDIYGLLNGEVRIIDDTTIDLTGYTTDEAMQAYVAQQITALNVDQYATDEELEAVIVDVAAIQTALANVYTKEEADAKFTDEAEAQAIAETAAAAAVAANTATDEEYEAAIGSVFGSEV